MTEDITWNPLGTITFHGFTDGDREMRRPNFGQLRFFSMSLKSISDESKAISKALDDRLQRAEADGDEGAVRAVIAEINEYAAFGLIDRLLEWHREVFARLSDPLPEDESDLPAYFADHMLAPEIVNHWKRRPKASGPTPPE